MKTIIKTLSLIMLTACFGKINAQNDLLSLNVQPSSFVETNYNVTGDQVLVSDFKRATGTQTNVPVITVRSEGLTAMQIRIFTMNGELAKEEFHALENGTNDLKIDMSNLPEGVYMVQFYTKDGSALRRFVKSY